MNNQSSSRPLPLIGMVTAVVAVLMVVSAAITAVVLTVQGDDDGSSADDKETTSTPTDETTEPPTPSDGDVSGDGYFYSLPGGWSDVSDDVGGSAAAVDSVSAWGSRFKGSRANFIVSIIPTFGSNSVDELEDTWKSSMRKSLGSVEDIPGTTIAGEEAIGIRTERKNENGVDVIQTAYLVIHGDNAYTLGMTTTPDRESDTKGAFDSILESWTWS